MRSLLILLFLLGAPFASARGVLALPDYPAMHRDADLVAIVRFTDLKDTGATKELIDLTSTPSGLQFRELRSPLEIVSLIKGEVADKPIICRLYRFPTFEECSVDLGDQDLARSRLTTCVRDFGLVHVLWGMPTRDIRNLDFLVYLKKNADGLYIPVTGESDSFSAIRELATPSISNPTKSKANKSEMATPRKPSD